MPEGKEQPDKHNKVVLKWELIPIPCVDIAMISFKKTCCVNKNYNMVFPSFCEMASPS